MVEHELKMDKRGKKWGCPECSSWRKLKSYPPEEHDVLECPDCNKRYTVKMRIVEE